MWYTFLSHHQLSILDKHFREFHRNPLAINFYAYQVMKNNGSTVLKEKCYDLLKFIEDVCISRG